MPGVRERTPRGVIGLSLSRGLLPKDYTPPGACTSPFPFPFPPTFTPLTLPHAGTTEGLSGAPEAQLPAHHAGRLQVPLAVADCAPRASLQDFHPALSGAGPALQTHPGLRRREASGGDGSIGTERAELSWR